MGAARLSFRMPRAVRLGLAVVATGVFFVLTTLFCVLIAPLLLLGGRSPERRARFTRRLNRGLGGFAWMLRVWGLLDYGPVELPEAYRDRPVLVIANHPTLIDVVLLLPALPSLTCVAKASWYRSLVLGPLLRLTEFIPGPGLAGDGDATPALERIEAALRAGKQVLVFPEGTRSSATALRRFRRGAIEAAVHAGAAILPVFIDVDHAVLMKGQPVLDLPDRRVLFRFEWLAPVETAGREGVDARVITRQLAARYQERYAQVVARRQQEKAK